MCMIFKRTQWCNLLIIYHAHSMYCSQIFNVPLKTGLRNSGPCQSHGQSQMTHTCVEQSRMYGATLLTIFTSSNVNIAWYTVLWPNFMRLLRRKFGAHKIKKKKKQLSDLPSPQSYSTPNLCVYWLHLCGAAFMSQDKSSYWICLWLTLLLIAK
jgi:hypothetical protein